MRDEFKYLEDENGKLSSTEDKRKIELLADELARSRHEAVTAQHRLNELESGRVLRTIRHVRKSIVNPIWGVKHIGEIPSLFKKAEVPPLLERPQSSRELLEELGHATLPSGLHNHPRTMKYPHLKVAVLGDPDWLSFVAHTFEVGKVEWNQLLNFGIDMFVIKHFDNEVFAVQTIKLMREKEVPFVWFIDEIDSEFLSAHVLDSDVRVTSKQDDDSGAIFVPPSIDVTEHNPANWQREPKNEFAKIAPSLINSEEQNDVKLLDLNQENNQVYEKAKRFRYVVCSPSDFDSETEYVQTMLQLYASGVVVITKGSMLLKQLIPKELHFFQSTEDTRQNALQNLQDPLKRERISIGLRRHVIAQHSHTARFEQLLKQLNIPLQDEPLVSIIASTNRGGHIEDLVRSVINQSYPNKELLLILHGVKPDTKKIKGMARKAKLPLTVITRPTDSLFGENLNLGVDQASGAFITKMDDDDYYGPNHIWDLYWAWMYSGALAVGKWGNFVYLKNRDMTLNFATKREERFGRHLPGATIFMARDDLQKLRFGRVSRAIDSEMLRRGEMRGGNFYSTHRYNFVRVRHGEHTYKQDDEDFIANSDGKPIKGFDQSDYFI